MSGGGGVFLLIFCARMCLPNFEILTFTIPIFVAIDHLSVHQFRTKTLNFALTGLLLRQSPQNTLNQSKLHVFVCNENPMITVPNSIYHVNTNPPPRLCISRFSLHKWQRKITLFLNKSMSNC